MYPVFCMLWVLCTCEGTPPPPPVEQSEFTLYLRPSPSPTGAKWIYYVPTGGWGSPCTEQFRNQQWYVNVKCITYVPRFLGLDQRLYTKRKPVLGPEPRLVWLNWAGFYLVGGGGGGARWGGGSWWRDGRSSGHVPTQPRLTHPSPGGIGGLRDVGQSMNN